MDRKAKRQRQGKRTKVNGKVALELPHIVQVREILINMMSKLIWSEKAPTSQTRSFKMPPCQALTVKTSPIFITSNVVEQVQLKIIIIKSSYCPYSLITQTDSTRLKIQDTMDHSQSTLDTITFRCDSQLISARRATKYSNLSMLTRSRRKSTRKRQMRSTRVAW